MARFIRGSLVLMLLLAAACRFSAARQETLFHFAISAILKAAATAESPSAAQPISPALTARNADSRSSRNTDSHFSCPLRRLRAGDRLAPLQQAAAEAPLRHATTVSCAIERPLLRVSAVSIAAAELRPAVEVAEPLFRPVAIPLERRIALARVQVTRVHINRSELRQVKKQLPSAVCLEAARERVDELVRELQAAHLLSSIDDGPSCAIDPDASASPVSTIELESLQAIGG